jgi:hypothetical protein
MRIDTYKVPFFDLPYSQTTGSWPAVVHTSRRTLRAESWTEPAQKAAILRGANAVTISLDSLYFPRRAKSACAIEKTPANVMPSGTTWINSATGNELFAGRLQHWALGRRSAQAPRSTLKTE